MRRLSVNEILDRLGLCQVHALIQKGAHAELAGLSQFGSE
jgi:hypothetical protein